MKRSLPFVFLLLSFLLFSGCGKASAESSSSEEVSSTTTVSTEKVDQLSRKELLKAYKRLRAEIAQKEKELAEKEKELKKTRSQLSNAINDEKHTRWKLYLVLLIIGLIIVGIVGTFVYAAIKNPKVHTVPTGVQNRCPRCGWEYHDGETECKNCHTHF